MTLMQAKTGESLVITDAWGDQDITTETPTSRIVERWNGTPQTGTLDEVVITGAIKQFHIEQMDDGHWWFVVAMEDGTDHTFNLSTKRNAPITALYEIDQ